MSKINTNFEITESTFDGDASLLIKYCKAHGFFTEKGKLYDTKSEENNIQESPRVLVQKWIRAFMITAVPEDISVFLNHFSKDIQDDVVEWFMKPLDSVLMAVIENGNSDTFSVLCSWIESAAPRFLKKSTSKGGNYSKAVSVLFAKCVRDKELGNVVEMVERIKSVIPQAIPNAALLDWELPRNNREGQGGNEKGYNTFATMMHGITISNNTRNNRNNALLVDSMVMAHELGLLPLQSEAFGFLVCKLLDYPNPVLFNTLCEKVEIQWEEPLSLPFKKWERAGIIKNSRTKVLVNNTLKAETKNSPGMKEKSFEVIPLSTVLGWLKDASVKKTEIRYTSGQSTSYFEEVKEVWGEWILAKQEGELLSQSFKKKHPKKIKRL